MTDDRPTHARIEDVLATLDLTSYRELLHDTDHRRRLLATMMADSDDPVLREIGQQLCDGLATLEQLVSVPAYCEVLERGYEQFHEIDFDRIAEQVDEVRRQEEAEAEPEPPGIFPSGGSPRTDWTPPPHSVVWR